MPPARVLNKGGGNENRGREWTKECAMRVGRVEGMGKAYVKSMR